MKILLKRIGYALLFAFILFNIMCAFQSYHFTRFYDNVPHQSPQEMGFFDKASAILFGVSQGKSKVVDSLEIQHTSITITTTDSFKLSCWHGVHPLSDSVNAKGTIIMFHGHGSNKSGVITEAQSFYNLGWNVFMVDFRAHGQSSGTECTVGVKEAKDIATAYNYITATGEKNIVLWGISMGAATITKAINDDASIQPKKVILEMPFGTMLDAVEGFVRTMHLPSEPLGAELTFWGGIETGTWSFGNKPSAYAKKIHCPVLLQWGTDDIRVTESETDQLFDNLATSQKTLVKYEGLEHESLCKNAHEKWLQSVTKFLN